MESIELKSTSLLNLSSIIILWLIISQTRIQEFSIIQAEVVCFCNSPQCVPTNYMCKSKTKCYSILNLKRSKVLVDDADGPSLTDVETVFYNFSNGKHDYGCMEDFDVSKLGNDGGQYYSIVYFCRNDLCNSHKLIPMSPEISTTISYTDIRSIDLSIRVTNKTKQDYTTKVRSAPASNHNMILKDAATSLKLSTNRNSINNAQNWNDTKTHKIISHASNYNWRAIRNAVIIVPILGLIIILCLIYFAKSILNRDSNKLQHAESSHMMGIPSFRPYSLINLIIKNLFINKNKIIRVVVPNSELVPPLWKIHPGINQENTYKLKYVLVEVNNDSTVFAL
ncbi:unnamed protein product [Gordionus sp. m RMFG-2023]|uniref:uncharacterized protein LOC135930227 n=1 Tax=Gordionus sp. m RMFG-2023 TaxID=3053472 RepID=UPI0030E386A4